MVKWKNPEYSYGTNCEGIQVELPELKENGCTRGSAHRIDDVVNVAGYGLFHLELTLLAGLIWMSDSFEIALLSIIGEMVSCEWKIVQWQSILLTSVVFAGMIFGCLIFGAIADTYGRRTTLGAAVIFLFVFGVTSAAAPSYYWLMAFRTLVGFALGGMPQVLTYCCEFFPARVRGRADFFVSYFWALGGVALYLITWGVITASNSWRSVLAVSAVPAFIAILSLKWYPESVRFYLVSNNLPEVKRALGEMLNANKKKMRLGDLKRVSECLRKGYISDLLVPKFRSSTLLFWFMGAATAFSYYGMILLTPSIVRSGDLRGSWTANNTGEEFVNYLLRPVRCIKMTQQDYLDLLLIAAIELPGLVVFTILIDFTGRKILMVLSSAVSGLFIFLLLIKAPVRIVPESFLFISRTVLVAQHQLIMIMVTEAFPTTLRGVAMGAAGAWYRFGALISPYISELLLLWNPVAAVCIFSASTIAAGVASIFLPVDGRGKPLPDTINEEEDEIQESTSF